MPHIIGNLKGSAIVKDAKNLIINLKNTKNLIMNLKLWASKGVEFSNI